MSEYAKHYLAHHGVKGMKWGVRKEYEPVGRKRKRPSNEINESTQSEKKRGLSDGAKTAIMMGATAAAAALATYGAYRLYESGKLNSLVSAGKSKIDSLLAGAGLGSQKASDLSGERRAGVLKRLAKPETLDQTISKINPSGSYNNCYNCVVATAARLCGFDVTAKGSTERGGMQLGKMLNLLGVKDDDCKSLGAPSVGKISDYISKHYKDGDVGVLSVRWNDRYIKERGLPANTASGHVLNWIVENGRVRFIDGQTGDNGSMTPFILNSYMDTNQRANLFKLGNVVTGLSVAVNTINSFTN